ncbi:hypothetical protein BUALT_BualtUnG0010800 [Buddleja alternifolia]|uniref:Peptidoglycan binding-like domain-containing protein n=1 Tax=Buddleja alternifolia TaxID=168488 RepID=A0AAV6W094_9LAMI|nr:hypothetical protein BUALT_BualtUnG0010800 [Buddleja alternifolia]
MLSHANSPQSNAENSSPLSLLNNLVGTLKGHKAKGIYELKMHLSNLGYMKNHNKNSNNKAHPNDDFFDEDLELAIKKYQLYFHLKVNGALDTKTVENLLLPRCGVADIINLNESRINNMPNNIVSHYTFFPGEPKWPPTKRSLTYSFPIDTRKDIMHPISEATKEWANVTDFKFKYIKNYDQADIKISFQYRDHGMGRRLMGHWGFWLMLLLQMMEGFTLMEMRGGLMVSKQVMQKQSLGGISLGDDVLSLMVEPQIDQSVIVALVIVYGMIIHKL